MTISVETSQGIMTIVLLIQNHPKIYYELRERDKTLAVRD